MHAWSGRGASPGPGSKLRKQTRLHCTTEGGEFRTGSKSCRDGVGAGLGKQQGTARWQTARDRMCPPQWNHPPEKSVTLMDVWYMGNGCCSRSQGGVVISGQTWLGRKNSKSQETIEAKGTPASLGKNRNRKEGLSFHCVTKRGIQHHFKTRSQRAGISGHGGIEIHKTG